MNKKGFTLIELIGTITILAIIMAIAIPNVISITRKNKNQTYINDARKMVTLAKYEFESNANITRPNGTENGCVIIKLNNLDQSELQKGPESGTYDGNESFVKIIYDKDKKTYAYSVQIIEEYSVLKFYASESIDNLLEYAYKLSSDWYDKQIEIKNVLTGEKLELSKKSKIMYKKGDSRLSSGLVPGWE